jgi:CelD/BcsL family acetyltransferase involved in cellulose biosynthesis
VFGSAGWVIPWIEVYAPTSKLFCILFFDENDELVGFVPAMLVRKCQLKIMKFIGSPLNDFNEIIVEPRLQEAVFKLLFDTLLVHAGEWDLFDCELLSESQMQLLTQCEACLAKFCYRQLHPIESPVIDLPSTIQEYYGRMSSAWRHRFKGSMNKICKNGEFKFSIFVDYEDIRQYLNQFDRYRLDCWRKRNQDKDLTELSQGETFLQFMDRVAEETARSHSIAFPCLTCNGRVAAMGIYFLSSDGILNYMKSWNIEYLNFSPGKVLELNMIEYAINYGVKKFDFGRGNESYKYDFLARNAYLQHCVFGKKSIAGLIVVTVFAFCEYYQTILLGRLRRISLLILKRVSPVRACD